jgi:hypothetical protein
LQKAAQKQEVLISYLNQEKILDTTPKGLVDLGWFGSSYDSLYPILKSKDATLEVGLFFGLRSHSNNSQLGSKKGYFFDERTLLGFKWALSESGIVPLEMFCSADHGTIVDFREEEGHVQPVFMEERNQKVIDWGLPLVREVVNCFSDNLLLDSKLVNPCADIREASADLLNAFWLNPSKLEAEVWGNFPWEKGHSDKTCSLAESYQWVHIAKSFLTSKLAYNQGTWVEGSIARSSVLVSNAMQIFLNYRKFLLVVKSKFR